MVTFGLFTSLNQKRPSDDVCQQHFVFLFHTLHSPWHMHLHATTHKTLLKSQSLTIHVKVVSELFVLHQVFPDLGCVDPSHKVFQVSGDQKSGVLDNVWTNPNVSLMKNKRKKCDLF